MAVKQTRTGEFRNGVGKAHRNLAQYTPIFNSPMTGTFNIRTNIDLEAARPTFTAAGGAHKFWLVRIRDRYGWAIRWKGTREHPTTWEVLTREPMPKEFKTGPLEIAVLERWDPDTIKKWAAKIKWFQSFPWGPQRADSAAIWNEVMKAEGEKGFSGKTVLDIGCNFGFHTIQAAKAGAIAIGYDKNKNVLPVAKAINEHIEMQDARFLAEDPGGVFDFIFYFSVHHQGDPAYAHLKGTMDKLKARAKKAVYSEFIIPGLSGGKSEDEIRAAVGGTSLRRYRHAVRREREIFRTAGTA